MVSRNPSSDLHASFVGRSRGEFDPVDVPPERLRLLEVDPVLHLVRG
jgi:hypothetical protein